MHSFNIELTKFPNVVHKFIQSKNAPFKGAVTEACQLLMNELFPSMKMTLKKWREEKKAWQINYEFPQGTKRISKPINYLIISEYIREHGDFNPNVFNLPDIGCVWLDHTTGMKLDFYMADNTGELGISSGDLQTHHFGENYPIKPLLTREGSLFTTIQPQLIQRVIKKRKQLIQDSDKVFGDDWIFELRNLISDVISIVDISLNQLYVKAEYSPLQGWKFDKSKLGERHGRRLNDKLKWVYIITGKNLNIEKERQSLDSLRELRNHFMHFDPPTLVVTWEEAAIWLNQVIDIGKILIQIRQLIGVGISYDLISFILQEEAVFVPIEEGKRMVIDKKKNENYISSTWK